MTPEKWYGEQAKTIDRLLADLKNQAPKPGRELSLALTKLEECQLWLIKAQMVVDAEWGI